MDSPKEKLFYVPDSPEKLASLPCSILSRSEKNKRVVTGRLSRNTILKHKNKKANPCIPFTITTKMDCDLSSKHAEVINANCTTTRAVISNKDDVDIDLTNLNISSDRSPSHSQYWAIKPVVNSNNFTISEFDALDTRKPSRKCNNESNREIMDTVIIDLSNDSDDEIPCTLRYEDDVTDIHSKHLVWQTSKTECLRNQFTQNMECIILSSQSDTKESDTIIVDNATVRSTPEDSVIKIVNLSQDSEVQISELIQPSNLNLFGVHSEPNVILLIKLNINAHGLYYNGNLAWVFDDNSICTLKSLFCVLTKKKLICYADSAKKILKVYNLDTVTSVHIVTQFDCTNFLYCCEVSISNLGSCSVKQSSTLKITFGCPTSADRLTWTQRIDENLTSSFPYDNYLEFTRLGWCYLKNWNTVIRCAAHSNFIELDEQQLTKEDISTIVDKCINFINAHGVLTGDIYRRATSSVVLTKLLELFKTDAWSVQLTPQIYSEHDVAGVLKRFLRNLQTPLISRECQSRFIYASAMENYLRRVEEYQGAIANLSPVSSNMIRKFFAHLHFIQQWSAINKLSAENLAAVWAPIIMPPAPIVNDQQTLGPENNVYIVRQIILMYKVVWPMDVIESKRDLLSHLVVRRMQETSCSVPQPSNARDLRFWVFMENIRSHFQVSLTPEKTSADVCAKLSVHTNIPLHQLLLEEQIFNGSMKRIVHQDGIVLDIVTRWGCWDDNYGKDNNLVIKKNIILNQMTKMLNFETWLRCQFRFANAIINIFKSYLFELNSSKGSDIVEEWDIKDIIWYFGHESKRDPDSRWTITFIHKNKNRRSKKHPFFGNTIAGEMENQLQWATALMFGQRSTILTTPRNPDMGDE